ncbi:nucleobase:cation symporter-2 family protein [Microbacterium pseudoresistens]|uniref:NCS2 family nucleobase:cation symporter-2 n=1 Tax=Microbacterium pseudoresistens TaxID=640634 RepID=A0A7Y9EUH1_9MICO|nr:nucleobase:cation symporter-2 family protein [Microbacterium pseudoresistens]NYD54192.1 NCS2 family nucleobase:cation symporter-2 [Microbacterium pseudoresistens]
MAEKKTAERNARPEDARLGILPSFAYGLQHVLTMYGGIIAPPLVIGQAGGMSQAEIGTLIACALFIGGLATILQTVGVPFFGSKLPLVQGVSFSGVATMLAIQGDGGIQAVMGAVLVASVIGLLIAPAFAMIVRFFPPVVTGTVITSIGLSLLPVAAGWSMGSDSTADDYGSVSNIGLAAFTLLLVVLLTKFGTAAIARLSILLALFLGTIFAVIVGKADFSQVGQGDIFALPTPFAFGLPTFDIAAIISMLIVILVTFTETTADILAVGEVVGTKVDAKRIAAGLRADMLSSAVSPVFNSFTQSAFAQNVGLVAITRVKSRFVVAAGGVILVILGVLPVLGRVVAAIPSPVLGGVGVVLFGTVAASGIATLSKVDYRNNLNLIIVAVSLGFGLLPLVLPGIYHAFPSWFSVIFDSAISSTTMMAILLNIIFNHLVRRSNSRGDRSVFVAAATRAVPEEFLEALEEGDHFVDGKLVDADENEVEIVPTGTVRVVDPRDPAH